MPFKCIEHNRNTPKHTLVFLWWLFHFCPTSFCESDTPIELKYRMLLHSHSRIIHSFNQSINQSFIHSRQHIQYLNKIRYEHILKQNQFKIIWQIISKTTNNDSKEQRKWVYLTMSCYWLIMLKVTDEETTLRRRSH